MGHCSDLRSGRRRHYIATPARRRVPADLSSQLGRKIKKKRAPEMRWCISSDEERLWPKYVSYTRNAELRIESARCLGKSALAHWFPPLLRRPR